MVRHCAVQTCYFSSKPSRHRFPNPKTDINRFKKWLLLVGNKELLKRPPDLVYANCRVCADHFDSSDFGPNNVLLKSAIPSLKLPGLFLISNMIYKKAIHFLGNHLRKSVTLTSLNSLENLSMMARPKVYVTRAMNKEVLEMLGKECDVTSWPGTDPVPPSELSKNIEHVDGVFCMLTDKIGKDVLDKAKNLKVISTMSAGYDHLDVEEIKKRGIKIGYTPETLTDATAELTVGLLLATCRRLMEANAAAREGKWRTWSPFWMCGNSLKNATVGFFGFGRIGQEIARRLIPFKTKQILYTTRQVKPEAKEIGAIKVEFDDLLTISDFVVVCCSFSESTREKFDLAAFKKMKKNAVFVNTARGGVVKQDDLVLALKDKLIWGAGLDVTTPEPLPVDHELFKLENCVILPHIGSAATDCRLEMAALTAENILTALKGQPMPSELVLS